MNELDRVVIPAKCSKTGQPYGMTFREMQPGEWHLYWAFKLDETRLNYEKYENKTIAGNMQFDSSYPGCPHCSSISYVRCGVCKKVACWDNVSQEFHCPWCNSTTPIGGTIAELTASADL